MAGQKPTRKLNPTLEHSPVAKRMPRKHEVIEISSDVRRLWQKRRGVTQGVNQGVERVEL